MQGRKQYLYVRESKKSALKICGIIFAIYFNSKFMFSENITQPVVYFMLFDCVTFIKVKRSSNERSN